LPKSLNSNEIVEGRTARKTAKDDGSKLAAKRGEPIFRFHAEVLDVRRPVGGVAEEAG
jgi:hypothetical protein